LGKCRLMGCTMKRTVTEYGCWIAPACRGLDISQDCSTNPALSGCARPLGLGKEMWRKVGTLEGPTCGSD
jgi:hypothetical protein